MPIKITDLVDPAEIDKLKTLDAELLKVLETYTRVAKDLAKGIELSVNVVGDIDKLEKLLVDKGKEAVAAQQQLTQVMEEQGRVMGNTTNTIQRHLMEQERVNKTQREAYTEHQKVKEMVELMHGSYQSQIKDMLRITDEQKKVTAAQKATEKAYKDGKITQDEYARTQENLLAKARDLKQEKARLNQIMTAEEKANQQVESSYVQMSQQLELMKKSYKEMNKEARKSEDGKELETLIQNLDAHLKDTAADMGEFQRNVGNYAIAGKNGVVATESLNAALKQEAVTMQDVADQTKILEEAKRLLDTNDAHYSETVTAINAQLEINKAKLSDVSDILNKEASNVAEAEAQNKRLQEALKLVDLSSAGAADRIKALNDKIAANTKLIEQNTWSLKDQEKANKTVADQMLNLLGINSKFGSSLESIESRGNVFDGLGMKVKAFSKTLLGLLANPWVLTFLGIAGAAAAVKWWYDYNKGLERASFLTKNFTGLVGDDMRDVRTKVQTLADKMGKGFQETIESANCLVNQFGISWNDAIQKMQDGCILGADLSGDMLSNIDKFSGAFKDAGISADEFMAVLVNTKDGLFDEKALKGITDAGMRIRNMSTKTQQALEDIGISGKKMQEDLEAGNITMLDAIQQVTNKLGELPPNAQEVGAVMVDVFGKKSAMAGEEVIKSISGIETSLKKMKDGMNDVQKLNEQQMKTQNELNASIAAMFDMTGGGFEKMTKSAKLYVTQGILSIIKGVVDVINWFIRLYNKSLVVRGAANAIANSFKNMWEVVKFICGYIVDYFKSIGTIIEGVFTLNWDKIQEGYKKSMLALKNNTVNMAKNIAHNTAEAFNKTLSDELQEINPNLQTTGAADNAKVKGGSVHSAEGTGWDPKADEKAKKAAKEAEKTAKEELKRLQALEDSKIGIMAEGHDKELALIRQKFKKKLDEIKGEGETQNALRLALAQECEEEIAKYEEKYHAELAKINLQNRLASVKEGSKEEYDLKCAMLEQSRLKEIEEAEKTGADVALINQKFAMQRQKLDEDFAVKSSELVEKEYNKEQEIRDNAYIAEVNALKTQYAKELEAAKGNTEKQEELRTKFEDDQARISEKYAKQTAQASINMIEDILKNDKLSAEDRLKYEQALAKAKGDLETVMADSSIAEIERVTKADDKAREKRLANAQQWMQVAADSLNTINELVSTVYDAKIAKIEEEQEANTAAGEAEVERITELVEKNVITEEEGEARKRAAEAQTAKKNEELEKKKQQLKHKQAVWDKANSIAQCGIQTAMTIMNALQMKPFPVGIAMAAIAGAMGAVQLATILATPIPKYAKGTDHHKGGPAIVGDGGVPELVMFGGKSWITPDSPTVVDLPAGAVVVPNLDGIAPDMAGLASLSFSGNENVPVIINNDYKRLEEKMDTFIFVMRRHSNRQYQATIDTTLNNFISSRI